MHTTFGYLTFNVISKEHKPWMIEELKIGLESELNSIFSKELHLFTLNADREQIVREMWRMRGSESIETLHFVATHLGLSIFSEEWEELISVETEDEFKKTLGKMIEGGHRNTGLERK